MLFFVVFALLVLSVVEGSGLRGFQGCLVLRVVMFSGLSGCRVARVIKLSGCRGYLVVKVVMFSGLSHCQQQSDNSFSGQLENSVADNMKTLQQLCGQLDKALIKNAEL